MSLMLFRALPALVVPVDGETAADLRAKAVQQINDGPASSTQQEIENSEENVTQSSEGA